MASVLGYRHLMNPISNILETCLGNKIRTSFQKMDIMMGYDVLVFDFERPEVFGNRLEVEISPFTVHQKDPEQLVKEVLRKAIEALPRADRMERERLWNL